MMTRKRNLVALAIAMFVIAVAAWSYHHRKQTHKQADLLPDAAIIVQAA